MNSDSPLLHLADFLYRRSYFSYRVLYRIYKAVSDREERAWIKSNVTPGMEVADIGANVGDYTEFMARLVTQTGVVHVFEPDKDNYQKLLKLTRKWKHIKTYNSAVSNEDSTTRFYTSRYLNTDNRIYPDESVLSESYDVQTVRLDAVFACDQLDFIKMDIQGAELLALQGGETLFKNSKKLKILLEVWPYGLKKSGASFDALVQALDRAGYQYTFIGTEFSIDAARAGKFDTDIGVDANLLAFK
jgi:FkbM family methyltransferase